MHRITIVTLALAIIGITTPSSNAAEDEARLLRFPAIHGDKIAFTYAGDLYTVPATGGTARKLTGHEGFEMFARYSPDGQWLAFTGQYDGNTEVYLIPAEGGTPKRLTYTATLERDDIGDRMGPNNIVMGWTPDSKKILFRSRMRSFNPFIGKLYTIGIDGGLPEELPLPYGGFASYSPDGSKLAYNRVFREFRTWKRYRGGMADDVWIYDFNSKETKQLLDNPAQDIIPMWHEQKIYFVSDRDELKRMNLYVHDLNTNQTRQLSQFKEFDVKFPSLGDQAIVFENGGWIYKLDLQTEQIEKVSISIHDDGLTARGGLTDVSDEVTNYEISPNGKRALFGARGEIFTVPAKAGLTRNLTKTSGVHERNGKWSPDGKWIAYISDADGEDELYIMPADGSGGPTKLTSGTQTYEYQLYWSPDSKKLLWGDKEQRLQYVDIESKEVTMVTEAEAWEITDYTWSPDSKWIAYAKPEKESMETLYLYSLEQKKNVPVTEGWYDADLPEFSADGKYLFFVSDRDFSPIYSQTEWNHAYQDMAKIYFVTLSKETENPLTPDYDDEEEEEKPEATKEEKKKDEAVTLKVDIDGIAGRTISLPIDAASYQHLTSVGDALYYIRRSSKDPASTLRLFDLKDRKETSLGEFGGYEISTDGKKMIVVKDDKYAIIDLPKAEIKLDGKTLDLSGMEVNLDRRAEWNQIFNECWRQMRDFFYAPNMHGVNWSALRGKYSQLLPYVRHRADLTYVIGEMISELNVGHAYISGGDTPDVKRIKTGLLGAELTRDPQTKYYRITRVLKGANWDKALRSPLTEVGVNVNEGDFIIAVNGVPTNEVENIYQLFVNKVGKPVTLKVNSKPEAQGAREEIVTPIGDEAELYYYNWVQDNIEKVNKATDGKVGYIHVPDMGPKGLNEFIKHFYPQITKKGLIIDVRGNGGGNVSPMLIERLRREIAMVGIARNTAPRVEPSGTFYGPTVCLMDEFSASDGDLFAWRFRHYKLGPLIGKRSWGGVVGIRGSLPLVDGGDLRKPEFSRYDVAGKKWIIEGVGVEPDIVVDNDPAKEYAGVDQQLNKGIEVILEKLKTEEKTLPEPPPFPKR